MNRIYDIETLKEIIRITDNSLFKLFVAKYLPPSIVFHGKELWLENDLEDIMDSFHIQGKF